MLAGNPSSSSDDTIESSFYGARHSERYTTKRTTSTFRDYIRSRSIHMNDPTLEQHSEENTSSISHEDSQTSNEQLHPNGTMNETRGEISALEPVYLEQTNLEPGSQQGPLNFLVTPKIKNGFEDHGALYSTQELKVIQGKLGTVKKRCSDFSEASPKEIYETTGDDWYATASDQEGSTISSKPYSLGAVNPVLECVNQILLQQSMEDTFKEPSKCKTNNSFGSTSIRPCRSNVIPGRRRVHFSTKNSMVHLLRNNEEANGNNELSQPLISLYNVLPTVADTSNYESVYSNDYEPIGSESASNHYVDMSAAPAGHMVLKSTQKIPPDLPPKPANLLKFKKLFHPVDQLKNDRDFAESSEPDYCSICELGVASVRVQTMADVHREPKSTTPSPKSPTDLTKTDPQCRYLDDIQLQKTDEIEEIFADIPKLPNVAAIIVPKQISSNYLMTTLDPLCLNSPSQSLKTSQPNTHYKQEIVPSTTSEINKRIITPRCPSTPTTSETLDIPIMKSTKYKLPDPLRALPIQEEFDWYNLDDEYKCTPKANKNSMDKCVPKSGRKLCSKNPADEYNLDEEFQHEEHPLMGTVSKSQAPSTHLSVTTQVLKKMENFEKFIKGPDMSIKPLPCKRKIYFNAPFV